MQNVLVSEKIEMPDLPSSDDSEFWGDAERYVNVPTPVGSDGPHDFERRTGGDAYCNHCGWGFHLDPGDYCKDGHVYDREKKLVI